MLNKILLELREEMSLSQELAAQKMKISRSALGYYERGERQPDATFIIKAAEFYNVTTDYLLGLSEYRSIENEAVAKSAGLVLSDKAIDFLKSCPPELLPTLDLLLSDPNLKDFLLEIMAYIYSLEYGKSSESVDIISHKLNEVGNSFILPEAVSRLLPRLQLLKTVNALELLLSSIKKAKYGRQDPGIGN
ncbi:MAG: HTH-type transcriptional regulator ImmR [Firmicutes bacterium ADurb.Bin373]|nr:helix-turn-helix transcriptional regulator [Bacillota bacterium]OQA10742.1 MAG: HTH-type transcriptional regulator ImmR [Firmicutes bacterium ADurb.Bin373]